MLWKSRVCIHLDISAWCRITKVEFLKISSMHIYPNISTWCIITKVKVLQILCVHIRFGTINSISPWTFLLNSLIHNFRNYLSVSKPLGNIEVTPKFKLIIIINNIKIQTQRPQLHSCLALKKINNMFNVLGCMNL